MKHKLILKVVLILFIAGVPIILLVSKCNTPPEPVTEFTNYNPVSEVSQERLDDWRNLAWKNGKLAQERGEKIETLERQIAETKAANVRLHTISHVQAARAKTKQIKTNIGFSQEVEDVIVKVAGEFGWSEYIYELKYIIKYESGGTVGAVNKTSSARGLGQLLKINYHLMPNGANSIGNAYEEMVGMCNYIKSRYSNPYKAYIFKKNNKWY